MVRSAGKKRKRAPDRLGIAEFQIAQQVELEPMILDRGEPGINPDIADQPARGVVIPPPEKTLSICFYVKNVS